MFLWKAFLYFIFQDKYDIIFNGNFDTITDNLKAFQ